jgi:thiamine kinase-like enzyme
MDNDWERSIAFYQPSEYEINFMLHSIDKNLRLETYKVISNGCRNSNYIIEASITKDAKNTNMDSKDIFKYLLRISPMNDKHYKNEQVSFLAFLLYEYIPSIALSEHQENGFSNDIIEQAAKNAAMIHNVGREEVEGLYEQEIPPFCVWFDYFLSKPNTMRRLGEPLTEQLRHLIYNHKEDLDEINAYQSFIHGDYRPANMIIDDRNILYVVDWEYACFGHTLADIGQFFRYANSFTKENIILFEAVYNQYAKIPLPRNWYCLSKLRDLINPLQMLGATEEQPKKEADLVNLVIDTLDYFNNREVRKRGDIQR